MTATLHRNIAVDDSHWRSRKNAENALEITQKLPQMIIPLIMCGCAGTQLWPARGVAGNTQKTFVR
jgi:hypothetical protein